MQAKKNIPDRLWDYGIEYVCETENLSVKNKERMKDFDVKLEQKWAVQSSDLKEQIQEVPQPKLL